MLRKSWGRVEHLNEGISPISLAFVAVSAIPTLVVIFRPSAAETLLWVCAEFAGGALFSLWDAPAFLRFMPEARLFFPVTSAAEEQLQRDEDRLGLFLALVDFPRKRVLYAWMICWFRLIPPYLVMVGIWSYSHSWSVQLGRVLIWSAMNSLVFNSLIYFESHEYISAHIRELHRRQDWSSVFKRAAWSESSPMPSLYEGALLVGSLANVFVAEAFFLATRVSDGAAFGPGMVLISAAGLLSAGRVWYVCRRFHSEALWAIFMSLDGLEPGDAHGSLPLHSDRLLARFEQTVNALAERVQAHEQELSHWVSRRAVEHRLLALAEFSALVVHDLSAPLQSIRLAADQLSGERDRLPHPESLDRIVLNSSRTLELVQSLRAYLRASAPPERGARVDETLRYVMRILSTRHPASQTVRLRYEPDPSLAGIHLDISTADLIHVLTNVIGNGLENMFAGASSSPELRVRLITADSNIAVLSIQDSGSGLSPERFEELTGFALLAPSGPGSRQSLGLRLVRRLVERNGGSLKVAAPQSGVVGTEFLLELRRLSIMPMVVEGPGASEC